MTRSLAAFVALAIFSPVTPGAAPPVPRPLPRLAAPSPRADFTISVASEVRLDGRSCRFKDVPADAVITRIEVDPDTREVVTVHFSTRK